MISQEENELLTRTGRGTPCGDLMRRYWQPVALTGELPPSSALLRARILGDDLVARSGEIPDDVRWKEHWKGRDTDPQPAGRQG